MSSTCLPRVAESTRELVSREFDDLGPAACLADIADELRRNNPELLDMAMRCARDVGHPSKVMTGFGMFYRALLAQAHQALARLPEPLADSLYLLPRVTPATREILVSLIDEKGVEDFTRDAIGELERDNPELLQMAHAFASNHEDYLGVLQGFALLYSSLVAQSIADRAYSQ